MSTPTREGPVRFARHLHVERGPETLAVIGEDGTRVLRGAALPVVAGLVDGTRTDAEIVAQAAGPLSPDDVIRVLDLLRDQGVVEYADVVEGRRHDRSEAFHRAATGGAAIARGRAPAVALHVLDDGAVGDVVERALESAGAEVRRVGARPLRERLAEDIAVVVVADHLDHRLADLDARFRATATPWLPVRPRGVRYWVGPLFGGSSEGPCWHCLASWLRINRRAEEAVLGRDPGAGPLRRTLPACAPTLGLAAHAVALEVDSWAHGVDRPASRGVVVHDTRDLSAELHEIRRRPQCAGCGDAQETSRRRLAPVFLGVGGEATGGGMERYRHLVSPVSGVVSALDVRPGPVPGTMLGRTGPVRWARRATLTTLRAANRWGHGGVGACAQEARTSALAEALERWSGQFHGDEYRVRARRSELGDDAVDPDDVLLVHPRQVADRERWNAAHGAFNQIGPPCDDEETDWSPLWSLRAGTHRWLPTAMLYYGAPGPGWTHADSNGCAAGPTRDEAIRRGLLELVERDAVALWWYNRTAMAPVEIDDEVRSAHRTLGRDVWALDLTSDLGVPVVAAISARTRPDGRDDRVMLGFGADTDPVSALRRALGELAGTTPLALGTESSEDPDVRRWLDEVDVVGHRWLRPGRGGPTPPTGPDPSSGVTGLVGRLVEHGLEPLVLDQTRPDIGLPVVRTVVPGLRPMWARLAPGRLFDAPVSLGRVPSPTRYDDLNPRGMFL